LSTTIDDWFDFFPPTSEGVRPAQERAINFILNRIKEGVTNVFLESPVGTGKSYLAWAIAQFCAAIGCGAPERPPVKQFSFFVFYSRSDAASTRRLTLCRQSRQPLIRQSASGSFLRLKTKQSKQPNKTVMPTFKRPPKTAHIVPGYYLAKVVAVEARLAESSGNPMIKLSLTLWPGGNKITTRLVFTSKALWMIEAFCESATLRLPDTVGAEVNLTADDCLGRYCYVWVKDREVEGDTFSNVHRFLTREAALKKEPALAKIPLPKDAPPPRRLASTAAVQPAKPARVQEMAEDGPPDDLDYGDETPLELGEDGYPIGFPGDEGEEA
jgi:hypothetical protein